MEGKLLYENREQLYKFLLDDLGFVKTEEEYSAENFGNFYIVLLGKEFLVQYVNDRSFLTIEIASHSEPANWYALSHIRDFIYQPDNINATVEQDNATRIKELNNFLKKDFERIAELLNAQNYSKTRKQLEDLLKERLKSRQGLRFRDPMQRRE